MARRSLRVYPVAANGRRRWTLPRHTRAPHPLPRPRTIQWRVVPSADYPYPPTAWGADPRPSKLPASQTIPRTRTPDRL